MRFAALGVSCTLAGLILGCDAMGPEGEHEDRTGSNPSSLIAFRRDGDRSIYTVQPDGSGLHLIAQGRPARRSGNLSFTLPRWSPDGENLAYLRYEGEDPGITTLEISERDGSRAHAVSESGRYIPEIAWAPRGDRLAFIRLSGGPGSSEFYGGSFLYVVRKDGSEQRNISTGGSGPVSLACPSWSPDGSRLAFVDRLNAVWTAGADGSDSRLVFRGAVVCARWSPDGARIAFVNDRNVETSGLDWRQEIYVVDPDGTGLTKLTQSPNSESNPVWSPDGSRLAFLRAGNEGLELYQIRSDGRDAVPLVSDVRLEQEVTWSPEGKQLAFISGFTWDLDLEVVNADGTGRRNITSSVQDEYEPDWR